MSGIVDYKKAKKAKGSKKVKYIFSGILQNLADIAMIGSAFFTGGASLSGFLALTAISTGLAVSSQALNESASTGKVSGKSLAISGGIQMGVAALTFGLLGVGEEAAVKVGASTIAELSTESEARTIFMKFVDSLNSKDFNPNKNVALFSSKRPANAYFARKYYLPKLKAFTKKLTDLGTIEFDETKGYSIKFFEPKIHFTDELFQESEYEFDFMSEDFVSNFEEIYPKYKTAFTKFKETQFTINRSISSKNYLELENMYHILRFGFESDITKQLNSLNKFARFNPDLYFIPLTIWQKIKPQFASMKGNEGQDNTFNLKSNFEKNQKRLKEFLKKYETIDDVDDEES